MKNIIVALIVACAAPAHADDLGDFIHKITIDDSHTRVSYRQEPRKHGQPDVHSLVSEIAAKHHLRPSLVHAVVKIESGYNCGASNHGSLGIMQVKQATATSVGVHGNLRECRTGLEAGVRYLAQSIAIHGDGCVAYSAYNSGLGASHCTMYGRRVLSLAKR